MEKFDFMLQFGIIIHIGGDLMKRSIVIAISIIILFILIFAIVLIFIVKHKETADTQESDTSIVSHYNSPVIPEGFHSIDTETAKWNKLEDGTIEGWNSGLVIEDSIGNQFVWIPVNLDFPEDAVYRTVNQYKKDELDINDIEDMQIIRYGGFYISRYEAGVPDSLQGITDNISEKTNDIQGIPVSKKGIIPWNYISLKNAKKNAESMYSSQHLSSGLPTLKQRDFIAFWLLLCGYDLYDIYVDSSPIGNYSNVNFEFTGYYSKDYGKSYKFGENHLKAGSNMILSTGATDRNMTNNIYDLAGNVWEYSNNYFPPDSPDDINGYICYGGHFDNIGSYNLSADALKNVVPLEKVGFRIVLYQK